MDLYSETILDHYRNPRHAGQLTHPTQRISEHNPICGDVIAVDVAFDQGGRLSDIAFTGSGCAISQAAMSLLSDTILGDDVEQIRSLSPERVLSLLGVPLTPARMQCALLGYTALKKAGILTVAERRQRIVDTGTYSD